MVTSHESMYTLFSKAYNHKLLKSFILVFSLNSEDHKSHFPNRNLKAYSTHPLLVQPCHYAGDPEWVSDTETSTLWDDDNVRTDWRGSHKTLKGSRPPAGLQSATYKDELWSEWHEWAFSKSRGTLYKSKCHSSRRPQNCARDEGDRGPILRKRFSLYYTQNIFLISIFLVFQ